MIGLLRERCKITVDLARGIRWCMENNKDGRLSQAARKKVMENYTIERVGEMYKEVYESIMKTC